MSQCVCGSKFFHNSMYDSDAESLSALLAHLKPTHPDLVDLVEKWDCLPHPHQGGHQGTDQHSGVNHSIKRKSNLTRGNEIITVHYPMSVVCRQRTCEFAIVNFEGLFSGKSELGSIYAPPAIEALAKATSAF